MSSRSRYWQAVRGICIVIVALIHAQTQLPGWSGDTTYWLYERQFINFPVAVFIFLAGYFVNPNAHLGKEWFLKRATRLLLPFLVWSAVFTCVGLITENIAFSPSLALIWVTGASSAHLYFPLVLMQLVLLTPLLRRALSTKARWLPLLITPASLWVFYFAPDEVAIDGWYRGIFTTWIVYYYAGMVFRKYQPRGRPRLSILLVLTGITLGELQIPVAHEVGWSLPFIADQATYPALILSIGAVGVFWAYRNLNANEGLAKLGDASYGIYFVHPLWLMVVNKVLEFGFPAVPVSPFWMLAWQATQLLVAIPLSYLTVRIAQRVLGKVTASRFFGF